MSEFECARYALLVTRTDIFCAGLLLGGVVVVLARWVEGYMERKFSVDQKKLDLMLGEALMKMKAQLDDKLINFDREKK